MKIRIMATENECQIVKKIVQRKMEEKTNVEYSISNLYPNRNSNLYRLYIEVQGADVPKELDKLLRGAL